jgi:uncharacterized protein (DUF302 family)
MLSLPMRLMRPSRLQRRSRPTLTVSSKTFPTSTWMFAMRSVAAFITSLVLLSASACAGQIEQLDGWQVFDTATPFGSLSERLDTAVKANKMGLVTTASASEGAKAQGITIPGNRVVGVFRNDFARRMLKASLIAGIEAPIRFYLVENSNGTSTLAYKKPSAVFAPYMARADGDLKSVAVELDEIFAKIAADATAVK